MTTRADAYRKWQALSRMTTARGCTVAEATTAKRLAASLAARWGFGQRQQQQQAPGAAYQQRYERAEKRAAQHFAWEYRACGKPNCRCARGQKHGPYKYGKKRRGHSVVSVYLGR